MGPVRPDQGPLVPSTTVRAALPSGRALADGARVKPIVGTDAPEHAHAHTGAGCVGHGHPVGAEPLGGMEVLRREECLELLAGAAVGRLAVTCGALPLVLPVSFRLADNRVFFKVARRSALDTATRQAVVAFEADEIDPTSLTGWSVVVVGVADDALASDCPGDLADAGVPWARPGSDHRIVALSTRVVSGRRIVVAAPPAEVVAGSRSA